MPVIGIDQVPANVPRPTGWDWFGQAVGQNQRALLDVLIAALGGKSGSGIGQVPTQPTPQNPGQLTFPSGASTPTSPLEMAQIRQMGGVPVRNDGRFAFNPSGAQGPGGGNTLFADTLRSFPNLAGDILPLGKGGVEYTQPTRWGMLPNLERQKTQAEIDKLQGDIALNQQLGGYYDAAGKNLNPPSKPQGFYQIGDVLERRGKRWKIVGLDTDGTPLVDPF